MQVKPPRNTGDARAAPRLEAVLGSQRDDPGRDPAQQRVLPGTLRTANTPPSSFLHELAQPLAAIALYAKTCRRMVDSGDFDRRALRDALAHIERLAGESGHMLQRQRRLRGPRPTLVRNAISLNTLIEAAAERLAGECRTHGIALALTLADNPPRVGVPEGLLELVLINLIRNARESIAAAGTRTGGRIRICSRRLSDSVLAVTVSDNGIGIPPEDTDRIFEPFYSGKAMTIGMGLPISRGIIESLGGTLTASPGSLPGAEFTLTLPASQPLHAG